jgi:hypothetical protein
MNTKSEQENGYILIAGRFEDSHRKPKAERLVSRKSWPEVGLTKKGSLLI